MTGDVCPECGQPLPAWEGVCKCGHGEVAHRFGNSETATTGKRGSCSLQSCGCDLYRPLEVPDGRQP